MPYGQAKEILEYSREFHRQVSNFYQKMADKAQSARVKLLLDYMVHHEKHLEKSLKDFQQGVSSQALNVWYQYSQEQRAFAPLDAIKYDETMTVDEVIKIAADIDKCLIESYKGVAETTRIPEIREIFENLLQMENQEKHVKARIALGINDM